jgi:ketosteroid isomerase-like protein
MRQHSGVVAWAIVIVISAGGITATSTSSRGRDTDQVVASERAWANAAVKADAGGMAKFMADDYIEIAVNTDPGTQKGTWMTTSKADWIALVQSGREKYQSVDLRNLKVYFHGDIATVTGEYSQRGINDGKSIDASGLYVDTWVKKNASWQIVSSVFP